MRFSLPRPRFAALLSLCLLTLSGTQFLRAQADGMTMSTLQATADQYVRAGAYVEGRPYLKELINRLDGAPEPQQKAAMLDLIYFYHALSFMQESGASRNEELLRKAIKGFELYIKKYPQGNRVHFALMNIADCMRGMGKLLEAVPTLERIINLPQSMKVKHRFKMQALEKIVEAYYVKRKWTEGKEWFYKLLNLTRDREQQSFAAAGIMQGEIEAGKLDDALKMLPYLTTESPARYEIGFNLALFKAADQLLKKERYNIATLLFMMVFVKDEIKAFYERATVLAEDEIEGWEISISEEAPQRISELQNKIANYKLRISDLEKVNPYAADLRLRIARAYVLTGRDWEGFWAYWELITKHPTYEHGEIAFYSAFAEAVKVGFTDQIEIIGEAYLDKYFVKRWLLHMESGVQVADGEEVPYPDNEEGQRFWSEERPDDYKPNSTGWEEYWTDREYLTYVKEVSVQLAEHYSKTNQNEKFFATCNQFIENYPNHQYTAQFAYLMGDKWMQISFETADSAPMEEMVETFRGYLTSFPDSPMVDGLLFWGGLGSIFIDDFPGAVELLTRLTEEFPDNPKGSSPYYRDGLYRSALAYFGMGDDDSMSESLKRLEEVIQEYPDANIRGEAHFFAGQLRARLGTESDFKKAIDHYKSVPLYTDVHRYIQDGVFNLAKLYDANEMYDEALLELRNYRTDYEEVGNIPGATYRIGNMLEKLGDIVGMLAEYKEAIENYGDRPDQVNLDIIIDRYVEKFAEHEEKITATLAFLNKLRENDLFREEIIGWDREVPIDEKTQQPIMPEQEWLDKHKRKKRFVFTYFQGSTDEVDDFDPTKVSYEVIRLLQRDDDFTIGLYDDQAPLDELIEDWEGRWGEFPKEKPNETFLPVWQEAKELGQYTLQFRMARALDLMGQNPDPDYFFSPAEFEFGTPAMVVWMGDKAAELNIGDGDVARQAYEYVIVRDTETDAGMLARVHLADFYSDFNKEEALRWYKEAENLFPTHDKAKYAAGRQVEMLREMGELNKAMEKAQTILATTMWRGEAHAHAVLQKGYILAEQGDNEQAHNSFQQCYLAYGGFPQWAAKAYLADARILQEMGRNDDAKLVIAEFLDPDRRLAFEMFDEYDEAQILEGEL